MTLHDELQRIADQAPVADVPDDTWARARRGRRRDRALTVAGIAAVLALLAGMIAWVPGHLEPPIASTDSSDATDTLEVPDHLYPVPERMSDRENDGSWMRDEVTDDPTVVGVGAAAWVTGQGLPVVVDAEHGGYHLLDLPDFAGNNENFARGLGTPVVALSPDGRELAYGYAVFRPATGTQPVPSGVRVVNLTTGDQREVPVPGEEGTAVSRIAWSPDGRWIAFAGRQQGTWTAETMGSNDPSAVVGRIAPGSDAAEVQQVASDPTGLAVDDDGGVLTGDGGTTRTWGARSDLDPLDLTALGRVEDQLWLVREDDELQETSPDRAGWFTVGVVEPEVGRDLTIAVDLYPTPGLPGADRPEPDWPWSDEQLSLTIGLGVAAAIAAGLGLRRLVRRYRAAR